MLGCVCTPEMDPLVTYWLERVKRRRRGVRSTNYVAAAPDEKKKSVGYGGVVGHVLEIPASQQMRRSHDGAKGQQEEQMLEKRRLYGC